MKSLSSQKKFFRFLGIALLCVFCAGLVILALEKTKTTDIIKMPKTTVETAAEKQNQTESKEANAAKEAFLDNTVAPTTNQPQSDANPAGTLTITAEQEGSNVNILSKITGVPSGECTLQIQNGAVATTQKAQLIYQPEFSSCAGYSIPRNVLGAGRWQITVTVTNPSGINLSQAQSLEVQ
jgi:cytoskeletal protein RodZ